MALDADSPVDRAELSFSLIYITVPDPEVGLRIGEALVRAQLAACVNLSGEITSLYEWEGKLEQSSERVLWVKARTASVPQIMQITKTLHPYQIPAIISWPLAQIEPAYRDFLVAQTAGSS